MTIYHRKAIELKYAGCTYREISKSLGGKLTETSLKKYFEVGGTLYLPYLEHEARMNAWTEENSRQDYKKLASYTSKVEKSLLKTAMRKGDYRLAFDILKDINDRAGLVVIRQTQVNIDENKSKAINTYEHFLSELKRSGIDAGTGLRVAETKMEKN